jgi:group I intron endonuclease
LCVISGMVSISLEEFPKSPGIYKFVNKFNGKIYIGESLDMNRRMRAYQYNYNKRTDQRIYRAMVKYGIENFDCFIIEAFPVGTLKKILINREKFWIAFYNSTNKEIGYNLCAHGLDNTGVKRSDEYKARMSEISKLQKPFKHTEESRRKLRESHLGKKCSNETRKRMSIAKKNNPPNLGKPLSQETKRKISQSKMGPNHPFYGKRIPWFKSTGKKIKQIDLISREVIKVWDDSHQAARELFENNIVDSSVIRKAAAGKRKSAHGFLWEFANYE